MTMFDVLVVVGNALPVLVGGFVGDGCGCGCGCGSVAVMIGGDIFVFIVDSVFVVVSDVVCF